MALTPFLISSFTSGLSTTLKPWIRPEDAFEPLGNAYVYRGTVQKRAGYSLFGTLPDGNPVMGIMRYIDETTGDNFLLVATTENLYSYNGATFDPIVLPSGFTGNISEFFNYTNWQPTISSSSFLFMTNNRDPVTYWDGTAATQPILWTDTPNTVSLKRCLDLQVYKQYLLYIKPSYSDGTTGSQRIHWSAPTVPSNVITDVSGNGGFLDAPTGDIIQSTEFVRDVLVVFFTNSTWIFRFTGIASAPFRWDKVNSNKSTQSPYGSVSYDERCTSIGSKGLIACDGVNVNRYDTQIIDYYETEMDQGYYGQAFSQRYDNLNQSWTLYVSNGNKFPHVDEVAPGSDQALIYNFLENTWATYYFTVPMTCLGTYYLQESTRWVDLPRAWEDTPLAWKDYSSQRGSLILLAGDTSGNLYRMDDRSRIDDNGEPIPLDIKTKRWNPSLQAGQKIQFSYIDIYYKIVDQQDGLAAVIGLNFYTDNSESEAATRSLTLDGPTNSQYTFKRIFLNLTGQFIQMEVVPAVQPSRLVGYPFVEFLGFIVWTKPAGRLTPGLNIL